MNLTKQIIIHFFILCLISLLSACGIKGDLYQTPPSIEKKISTGDESLEIKKKEATITNKKQTNDH